MKIKRVAEGAYFVPSYSEQTLAGLQPGIVNLGVTMGDVEEDREPMTGPHDGDQEDVEPAFTKEHFDALRDSSRRRMR